MFGNAEGFESGRWDVFWSTKLSHMPWICYGSWTLFRTSAKIHPERRFCRVQIPWAVEEREAGPTYFWTLPTAAVGTWSQRWQTGESFRLMLWRVEKPPSFSSPVLCRFSVWNFPCMGWESGCGAEASPFPVPDWHGATINLVALNEINACLERSTWSSLATICCLFYF